MDLDYTFRPVRSADRTLDLLELLAKHQEGVSFKEIASQLQLPKSSLSGLLRTLLARQYVTRTTDGRRFRLGAKVLDLSAGYRADHTILHAAEHALASLAQQLDVPAYLATLDGDEVRYIATSQTSHAKGFQHQRFPAYTTAAGKCILAYLPSPNLDEHLRSQLTDTAPAAVTSLANLRRELSQVRRMGYAYDIEGRAVGQHAIAAPLYDEQGQVIAALEITLSKEQLPSLDLPSLPHILREATAAAGGRAVSAEIWQPERVKIAWSMGTLRNQAYQTVYRTVEHEANALGADVLWSDAQDDPSKQIVDVSSLLALQPDILIIHPAHAGHADMLFTIAAQAGVTAINFQRPAHSSQVEFFIGGDTAEQGRITAAFVATLLKGEGNVALIEGDPSNDNARNLAYGTRSELQRHANVRILDAASCPHWSRERARTLAEAMLDKHGEALHAFLVANDDMTGGVAEALALHQRSGKVFLVGGDGDLDALERIRSGVQHGTAFQNWMHLGRETVRFAIAAATGQLSRGTLHSRSLLYDPPSSPVYVKDLPYTFIDRSNLNLLERFWAEAIGMALPEMLPLIAPAFRALDAKG